MLAFNISVGYNSNFRFSMHEYELTWRVWWRLDSWPRQLPSKDGISTFVNEKPLDNCNSTLGHFPAVFTIRKLDFSLFVIDAGTFFSHVSGTKIHVSQNMSQNIKPNLKKQCKHLFCRLRWHFPFRISVPDIYPLIESSAAWVRWRWCRGVSCCCHEQLKWALQLNLLILNNLERRMTALSCRVSMLAWPLVTVNSPYSICYLLQTFLASGWQWWYWWPHLRLWTKKCKSQKWLDLYYIFCWTVYWYYQPRSKAYSMVSCLNVTWRTLLTKLTWVTVIWSQTAMCIQTWPSSRLA